MTSIAALLSLFFTFSVDVFGVSLDEIDYINLPGDKVQFRLSLSEPLAREPLHFSIDNPARIALDFPEVQLNIDEKKKIISVGDIDSFTVLEAAGRTRVIINLLSSLDYDLVLDGSDVLVVLGRDLSDVVFDVADIDLADHHDAADETVSQESTYFEPTISDIDFQKGGDGQGQITVTLSEPSTHINMDQNGDLITIDFINTTLLEELDRRLDVVDFSTPVKEIDTTVDSNNTKMTISTVSERYDHIAYQVGNSYVVEIKPLTAKEIEKRKKQEFTGERLSLNFQSIEVRAVLQVLADVIGLNLVMSDTVSGNITMRLKNVPWDQALDIILRAKGLDKRIIGNVMMIAPQDEIIAREQLELEAENQFRELAPLRTEFLSISYAKASDLAGLISQEDNDLLSERGNISIDERTNTLIIQDTSESLEAIKRLINELDIPVRQVLIESRIVNATETFSRDIGLNFGYSRNQIIGDGRSLIIGGGNPGNTAFPAGPTGFSIDGNENFIVGLPTTPEGGSAAFNLAFGRIGSWLIQLQLNAAIAEGTVENIANPKVITANQREAVIEDGVEIPFQEASSSGATSVSFKKAVLGLRVTPQITPDDQIIMDLTVSQDTRGVETAGVPSINTRSVSTQVLVDNGETVVLGGVYTQTDSDLIERVPFFSELPYLGALFRNTSKSTEKGELLIFVTPKILKESLKI